MSIFSSIMMIFSSLGSGRPPFRGLNESQNVSLLYGENNFGIYRPPPPYVSLNRKSTIFPFETLKWSLKELPTPLVFAQLCSIGQRVFKIHIFAPTVSYPLLGFRKSLENLVNIIEKFKIFSKCTLRGENEFHELFAPF